MADVNISGEARKRTPANAARSAHGERLYGPPPKHVIAESSHVLPAHTTPANCKGVAKKATTASTLRRAPTTRQRKPQLGAPDTSTAAPNAKRRIDKTNNCDALSKPEAVDIIRHLVEHASPHQVRTRLGESNIPNVFEDARKGKFGRIGRPGGEREKRIRKMFCRIARDTHDGQRTAANAEYFLQILEETAQERGNEVPFLAEEMFKLLLIIVSYRKPPPANFGSAGCAMTKKQVLHIVGKELREAIREVEQGI